MNGASGSARDIPVADRLDILDLYARQSHSVDGGDGDGWARTYTVDGVFHSPTYDLTARGYEQLKAFAENSNGAALARGEQFRHVISAIALTPIGPGVITARAYLTILATTADGSRVDRSLLLEDELRLEGDRWLFSAREVYRD